MKPTMNFRGLSIIPILCAGAEGSRVRLGQPNCGDARCRKACMGCPSSAECTGACDVDMPLPVTPPPPTRIKIAAILDSLSDESCCGKVYPPYLQTYLDAAYPGLFEVREFAVYSTTICENGNLPYIAETRQSDPTSGKTPYLQALAYNSDYVIIVGGANDSKSANWIDRGCKDTFQGDAQRLYSSFIDRGSRVFASDPPSVGTNHMRISNSHIREQTDMICCAAEAVGATRIPTYAFTQPFTKVPCYKDSTHCWFPDGVHFNDAGAESLAEFFGCYVLKQCNIDFPSICTTLPAGCTVDTLPPCESC